MVTMGSYQYMNLYTCYHPKATWKCSWCLVHKDKLHNFDLDQWSLCKFQVICSLVNSKQSMLLPHTHTHTHTVLGTLCPIGIGCCGNYLTMPQIYTEALNLQLWE